MIVIIPILTAQERIQKVLKRIEEGARQGEAEVAYADLFQVPELPLSALADVGTLTRLEGPSGTLPSLAVENGSGQAQIEVSPFGPLALVSSDGEMNTDPIAQALLDAGITPLFPGDLDQAAPWHGTPLGRWLFPRRLPDALALFEGLRGG